MPNDNHEQYDGNDICTYTDLITIGNTLTTAQVDACILAAGEAPADNPKKIYLDNKESQPGPNSFSPFYFVDPDLWYSEEELVDAKGTWYNYLHTVYASTQQNALATQLKVDNYRNFATITEYTETINGTSHKYYGLTITTKYGDNNDPDSTWTDSILKPMYVLAEGDARTGIFLDEVMCKQEYNFTNSWGSMCTDLGFVQGRRNLKDNESGGIIPYGIWQSGLAPAAYHVEGGHQYGDSYTHHLQWQNNPSSFYTASVYNKVEDLLFIVAIGGLKFEYDDILYKPIVENGVVVGYTDDMTKTSEWDDWKDIGDHEIPVTPPGPSPSDDDDIDALTFGSYSGGAGAFANVWYTTASELGNLKEWMNKAPGSGGPPQGYNPMDSILSLMIYPIAIPTQGSLVHISFFNANDPDNHLISSDAQGYFTEGKTFEINLGSYTIDPHHDNDWAYLDYDTAIELYIPFCGVYQIDTQVVMGTTLSAKMWVDPVMGSCTFCAYANNIPVAMGNGQLGVSLPISSQQFSMVQAAIATNRGNFAASAIGTVLGAVASAIAGGMSGSAAAVTKSYGSMQMARGALTRQAMASQVRQIGRAGFGQGVKDSLTGALGTSANAALIGKATGETYNVFRTNKMLAAGNSTAVSGSFGGSQDPWRLPMTPYVKILRERTHVSDMHVSTIGKLHVMGATLNDCSGFTTVVNPDLSGLTDILTQSELAELYTTLSNGVYC